MNKTKRHKYCLTDKTICLYNAVKERVLRMNRDILKQIDNSRSKGDVSL